LPRIFFIVGKEWQQKRQNRISHIAENGNDKSAKLTAEVAKLRAENERLKTDHEI
jgi:hypothetical protein